MNYRRLIVCLDDGARARARLDFAIALAARHGAHLTGLHLSYMPGAPYLAYDGVEPLFVRLEQDLAARQEAARAAFEQAVRAAGLPAAWLAARSLDMSAVIAYCRASDLVIAGQPDPADPASYIGEGFPSRFLLGVGRPVLFAPRAYALKPDFARILVGWNGSREAARALFDALPLLARAQEVAVFGVQPAGAGGQGSGAVPAPDLAALLAGHGIRATVDVNVSHEDPAEWLMARALDLQSQADLLVTGAYGHSRLSELVLGGVTRRLLADMPLPVLMSH